LHSSEIKKINWFINVSVPNIATQHANHDSSLCRLATEFTTGFSLPYPYFEVVVRLVWSKDPESYAGSNVVTGRASHAGQVEGDEPDEKG
jgi:hypothetical protein